MQMHLGKFYVFKISTEGQNNIMGEIVKKLNAVEAKCDKYKKKAQGLKENLSYFRWAHFSFSLFLISCICLKGEPQLL